MFAKRLGAVLIAFGLVLLGIFAAARLHSVLGSRQDRARFEEQRAAERALGSAAPGDGRPAAPPPRGRAGGRLALVGRAREGVEGEPRGGPPGSARPPARTAPEHRRPRPRGDGRPDAQPRRRLDRGHGAPRRGGQRRRLGASRRLLPGPEGRRGRRRDPRRDAARDGALRRGVDEDRRPGRRVGPRRRRRSGRHARHVLSLLLRRVGARSGSSCGRRLRA